MKKLLLLILVMMVFFLFGCADHTADPKETSSNQTSASTTEPATEAPSTEPATEATAETEAPMTTEPTTEESTEPATEAPTTVPTEPPVVYRHPLTGEVLDEPLTVRPTAIVINNIRYALPHHGTSQADIIFEIMAEGGITRMMGLFSSVEGVGEIGTVRSARDYYVSLALGHDAVYLHAGGSPQA